MNKHMKGVKLELLWQHAQDLNFGEINQVFEAAVSAAEDKIFQIRKDKIFIYELKPKPTKPTK